MFFEYSDKLGEYIIKNWDIPNIQKTNIKNPETNRKDIYKITIKILQDYIDYVLEQTKNEKNLMIQNYLIDSVADELSQQIVILKSSCPMMAEKEELPQIPDNMKEYAQEAIKYDDIEQFIEAMKDKNISKEELTKLFNMIVKNLD